MSSKPALFMSNLIEIRKGLDLLYNQGDMVEMRVPRKHEVEYSSTTSGFFDDLDRLAEAIQYINTKKQQTVYVTLNPLKRDWQEVNNQAYVGSSTLRQELQSKGLPLEPRMKKSVSWESGKTHYSMRMAEDSDILSRRWILIDIDAGQPAGTNSSEQEHVDTLDMAMAIREWLTKKGFPKTGLTNSGNGHHVYLRVDLPNDASTTILVKRFLKALNASFVGRFGTAMVDEGMFNAARITKAAGTIVYKGPPSPDRPNRQSCVLHMASPEPAALSLIESIANEYKPVNGEFAHFNPNDEVIDDKELRHRVERLKAYLDYYDVEYGPVRQSEDYVVVPCTCPNASEHTMNGGELEAIASVRSSGQYGFCCQHAHCQQLKSWKGFRQFVESRSDKPAFEWETITIMLHGQHIAGPKPIGQQPVIVNNNAKRLVAAEILNKYDYKTACELAEEQGISERTMRRVRLSQNDTLYNFYRDINIR
jgi:hypothetical protein